MEKSPDFKWSGFQMVGTIAKARLFENQTIWNPTLKKSGFQMYWIQFPTVIVLHLYFLIREKSSVTSCDKRGDEHSSLINDITGICVTKLLPPPPIYEYFLSTMVILVWQLGWSKLRNALING